MPVAVSTSSSDPRRLLAGTVLALVALLPGCQRREAAKPAPHPHYVVGAPWQGSDGAWFYPREDFAYHATGLAVVDADGAPHLTADGESYDPQAMAAALQTLQLPAIVTVSNLENGRRLSVRVNDRGPGTRGRLISLTPAAAALLGIPVGRAAQVAVDEETAGSQTASSGIAGGPHLDIATAPVVGVQEQALPAPGSVAPSPIVTAPAPMNPAPSNEDASVVLAPLPARATQGSPAPGTLWIDAGRFSRRSYADQIAAGTGGTVRVEGSGRQQVFLVRCGPYRQVADADAALDLVVRAGVTGARIIVE